MSPDWSVKIRRTSDSHIYNSGGCSLTRPLARQPLTVTLEGVVEDSEKIIQCCCWSVCTEEFQSGEAEKRKWSEKFSCLWHFKGQKACWRWRVLNQSEKFALFFLGCFNSSSSPLEVSKGSLLCLGAKLSICPLITLSFPPNSLI